MWPLSLMWILLCFGGFYEEKEEERKRQKKVIKKVKEGRDKKGREGSR